MDNGRFLGQSIKGSCFFFFFWLVFLSWMDDMIAYVMYWVILVVKNSKYIFTVIRYRCALSTSKHPGDDIYTWGWGGANGTFFEEGHSSGGQLVSCFQPPQLFSQNAAHCAHLDHLEFHLMATMCGMHNPHRTPFIWIWSNWLATCRDMETT